VPIEVKCGKCGKGLKAPDSMAGKKAKCPGCGSIVVVPQPMEEILDAEIIEPTPAPTADLGSLLDDELAYRVAEPDPVPTQSVAEDRRPCPACGEMIVSSAAVCRFCGEIFDPALKKKAKKKKGSSGGDDDELTTGEIVLAILCGGIGCILGIIWVIQGKSKGWKMVGISILAGIVWRIIGVVIELAMNN
jgi:hypothetical protein